VLPKAKAQKTGFKIRKGREFGQAPSWITDGIIEAIETKENLFDAWKSTCNGNKNFAAVKPRTNDFLHHVTISLSVLNGTIRQYFHYLLF
jgi:hypothetical protein